MTGREGADDPLAPLRAEWLRLMREALPAAAADHPEWPIRLDHCFGRVILDTVYDRPWRDALASPAWRTIDGPALHAAITLAQDIVDGRADLTALNRRSLEMRGRVEAVHRGPRVR